MTPSGMPPRAGFGPLPPEFAADSPLEGDGFEPSVPHKKQPFLAAPVRSRNSPSATKTGSFVQGTDGSNPSPSCGESVSLPELLSRVENPGFRATVRGRLGDRVG